MIVPIVEAMLVDAENLKRAGADYAERTTGRLLIATTHRRRGKGRDRALPRSTPATRSRST